MTRALMQGSEAMVPAECRFFAGYPMTQFTEVLEHMAKKSRLMQESWPGSPSSCSTCPGVERLLSGDPVRRRAATNQPLG